MEQIPFYKALQMHQPQGGCTLVTCLDGSAAGQQFLLCGEQLVWKNTMAEPEAGWLEVMQRCTATGYLEWKDTRAFAERFGAAPQLVVCGGGHVALAVVQLAKLLGLPVQALEDRSDYAEQLRQAGAEPVLCAPFEQALQMVSGGSETYFVVVTRAHTYDVDCLKQILTKPAAYVGMMGSRGRSGLVRRQLLEAGLCADRVEALHAPIGLSIGAQTAEEIALSILAEIVQIKNARPQTEGFVPAILNAMEQAFTANESAVLVTIVARHGSTPRDVGAKMLVFADGRTVGSVGGGIMEYRTMLAAQEMLSVQDMRQKVVRFSATGKDDDAALAACGGTMDVLLQVLPAGKEETP